MSFLVARKTYTDISFTAGPTDQKRLGHESHFDRLELESQIQEEAVKAPQQSVAVSTNQYKAGITSYLDVVTAQTGALNNERTAAIILGNRLNATVLLIKALGGSWNTANLP